MHSAFAHYFKLNRCNSGSRRKYLTKNLIKPKDSPFLDHSSTQSIRIAAPIIFTPEKQSKQNNHGYNGMEMDRIIVASLGYDGLA
jgi:hypothetical protein